MKLIEFIHMNAHDLSMDIYIYYNTYSKKKKLQVIATDVQLCNTWLKSFTTLFINCKTFKQTLTTFSTTFGRSLKI